MQMFGIPSDIRKLEWDSAQPKQPRAIGKSVKAVITNNGHGHRLLTRCPLPTRIRWWKQSVAEPSPETLDRADGSPPGSDTTSKGLSLRHTPWDEGTGNRKGLVGSDRDPMPSALPRREDYWRDS
jgi:hypothetical protein